MLTVSPSISPLSYRSILISPASASIFFTNEFSLVVSAIGGGGKTFRVCLKTEMEREAESVCGFITWLICVAPLTGDELVFSGTGFNVAGCFFSTTDLGVVVTTGLGAAVRMGIGFIHSRKVISSNAKSLPQPPGALSIMTNVNALIETGVVKIARCWVQCGASRRGRSP